MMYLRILFLVVSFSVFSGETIYGLMMTGKDAMRERFAQIAVKNFFDQEYPDLKLVIVNHSPTYSLGHLDERIIEIKLDERPESIGTMRNIGLDNVPNGAVFVNWDDDDWRVTQMVPQMYEYMKKYALDCTALCARIDYIFPCNTCYITKRNGMSGLMMCRKKDITYPEVEIGEDARYLAKYKKRYKFMPMKNPAHWYLRFIHTGNVTKPEGSKKYKVAKNIWPVKKTERRYMEESLQQYAWVYEALNVEPPKFIRKVQAEVSEEDAPLPADAPAY
ncbi:MAG: hypothetical protein P0S94_05290 [Simkaniaceae bacterium]|nr:hypothetical protein [Simkaniaceae bacterium]